MARIRSLKPEFFLHEKLAELSPLHRLLFAGLWTLADKLGRQEDRPKRIKAAILPWDDLDVNAALTDLAKAGLLVRYSGLNSRGENKACIWIPGFERNQKPHPKESAFDLPEPGPDVFAEEVSRQIPETTEPGKGVAQPWKGDDEPGGVLIVVNGSGSGKEGSAPAESPAALQGLWNEKAAPALPRWKDLTDTRKKHAKKRLEERGLAGMGEVLSRINASSFCLGHNDRGWRADPDWFLRPDTATKVLEGKYDDRQGPAPPKPAFDPRKGAIRAEDVNWEQDREVPF